MNIATTPQYDDLRVSGQYTHIDGEACYRIANSHLMDEFFISLVSSSDHWMFISSNGALTAGRRNPDGALFPYYSADKILDTDASCGPRTIIQLRDAGGVSHSWEPFSTKGVTGPDAAFATQRNLYKNLSGNRIYFEEINQTLGLTFRYGWTFGNRFGFIRSCCLVNHADAPRKLSVLDGLLNILPHGVGQNFQLRYSNLGNAYKKSELLPESQLGLFYLSSIPTDRAEPSEGLRATVAWQLGLDRPKVLLSENQVESFLSGDAVENEIDVRGCRGAYLLSTELEIEPAANANWQIMADVGSDQTDVINQDRLLTGPIDLSAEVDADVAHCQRDLAAIVSAADGRQTGEDRLRIHRHQSNVLFNAMRGGVPLSQYQIPTDDFASHVRRFDRQVFERNEQLLESLISDSKRIDLSELRQKLHDNNDQDLVRIGLEYLPLTFSRRHGDPTRPWNAFSIDVRDENDAWKVSYQGNWRDIFQNWESLAVSYPGFLPGMIFRFVNASTADGYNPYRLTSTGFEWETVDPQDPWSNIGYWGDHQIVYLLKLLELSRRYDPNGLNQWLAAEYCTYAQIPYRIREYSSILANPTQTIDFDDELARTIDKRVAAIGSDGKLLRDQDGKTLHVSLVEKLLVPALAKLTNFVPDGGIWLNTQRPEWNDANNALVGNGLSMVTVCYLRRYFAFLRDWFADAEVSDALSVSNEVAMLLQRVTAAIALHNSKHQSPLSAAGRKQIVDLLSSAGSDYREQLYGAGFSGENQLVAKSRLAEFFGECLTMLDNTISVNRREDGLYHSYNLMKVCDENVEIEHLYEMLEGQVAVLSCGLLSGEEAADVLDALRGSSMYRADQQSYMLYPDRELPRFVEKNRVPKEAFEGFRLLRQLVASGDSSVVKADVLGEFHFNGDFRNSSDLRAALQQLAAKPEYADAITEEGESICELFEDIFQHRQFTGRSGTFFGYEGLGSIYWHMVSKLALATMENMIAASEKDENAATLRRLREHYRDIRGGIATGKTPAEYGAFPSDPYSHTPAGAGVQQPGMTGQVKEDILSRFAELGLRIDGGIVGFDTRFFEREELLQSPSVLEYIDHGDECVRMEVPANCFAWTICQTPVIYQSADESGIAIHTLDPNGKENCSRRSESRLTVDETRQLCSRSGQIKKIEVFVPRS